MDEQPEAQAEFSGDGWVKQPEEPAITLLDFKKTIRIAVTGDVLLTAAEAAVIDTEDFQRLRGVRQLGTVNLVFPTALHTRFDHSLGTLAMADEMILAIASNAKSQESEREITLMQRKLARMYALLHDITHVPFGHTIEDEMHLFPRHDKNPARIERFLGPNSEVADILQEYESPQFYDRFMAIYLWEDDQKSRNERKEDDAHKWIPLAKWFDMEHDDAFVHDIVSNTVCADLLDYVARDSYFCNLEISLEYRFVNYLYLKRKRPMKDDPRGEKEIRSTKRRVFVRLWKPKEKRARKDILTDLTRLMDARYLIAERAYFHHAKLVTGAMLARAIQEYDMIERDESYLYENSDDTLLRRMSDWEAREGRTADSNHDALPLATLLSRRKLHRTVRFFGHAAFEEAQDRFHDAEFQRSAIDKLGDGETRRDFENWCAAIIGRRPGTVLVYAPPVEMNMKVAQVNVRWKDTDTTLNNIDDPVVQPRLATVMKAHSSLWSIRLIVSRDVNEKEVNLLKEAFELSFLVPSDEEMERRIAHAEQIVEYGISGFIGGQKVSPDAYRALIKEQATPLSETARGKDSEAKLRAAIQNLVEELGLSGIAR